jgi:EmrB/QacA subfamily drug resistance transporter
MGHATHRDSSARTADQEADQMTYAVQNKAEPNRWAVFALLGAAQLMVVLDGTIVNIALPSAQRALHFSTDSRQWIITAYALAFGSLLLLGGKLGDLFGRKWTFIAGLLGFSLASAIGGLSQSFAMLVAARALQGAFGALLAPSALSLLTVTFAGSPDRPKAFGIFSAIAAGGASVGLLLGGVLTQALSWRWCLYVNLAIAVPAATFALRLLVNHSDPQRARIDLPGVLVASAGLFGLVYGLSNAETQSWTAPATIVALVASPVLLVAFAIIERRAKHPLLPLHVVRDRARGGAYTSVALAGCGVFGVFLFLTFYMQQSLGFSPLATGLAFLPMTAAIAVTSITVQTRVLPRTGARPIVVVGMAFGVIAMLVFTRLTPGAGYPSHILPGLILIGVGMGCIFGPSFATATLGVDDNETGVAAAMVNTSVQVGGSVGTSLLSTLFASAAASYAASHVHVRGLASAATVHGYTAAFWWAAGIFTVGLLLALFILPAKVRTRARASSPPSSPNSPACDAGPARDPTAPRVAAAWAARSANAVNRPAGRADRSRGNAGARRPRGR